ncbi:MAG: phosphatidate cytidylyltransferase [Treponema sp.]|nr:phosphatidate cytidylyltransferase [Candidatus Treponema equifaecale]
MNKVGQRLCVFFFGLPLAIALVWFNSFHHIAFHAVIFAASALGSGELYNLLRHKMPVQPRPLAIIAAVLPAFVAAVCAVLELPSVYITYALIVSILAVMAYEVLAVSSFEDSVFHLASSVFVILYTGFLVTFVSRMTMLSASREFIAIFILMVSMCDSVAWFFGVLFGKNNKGFIKASPNKSVAGFIGGFAGSILSGIIGWLVLPEVFTGSIVKVICLGIVMAFASIVGDLAESVLKRSAGIKDSGTIVPGRGGVLDSIDSIIFAAPIYYFGISVLFL